MRDRYFFDKREWKRRFVKYGIIFLLSFLPLVLFNIYFSKYLGQNWLVVFVDCIILLIFVLIGNSIANRIFEKKDRKLARLRKEREEIEARKIQIMEDSYAKKRQEKEKKKQAQKENIVIGEKDELENNLKKEEGKPTKQKTTARRK